MSNVETVIETLEGLFEGQTYTEEERTRLGAFVMNKLEVPGTIWSLEDFEEVADEELTSEERDKVCREAYNGLSNDLDESDWDKLRGALERPTQAAKSARPVELGELYYLHYFDQVVTKPTAWNTPKQDALIIQEEVFTVKDHPTGNDLYRLVNGGKFTDYTYFRVEKVVDEYEVREMIYR